MTAEPVDPHNYYWVRDAVYHHGARPNRIEAGRIVRGNQADGIHVGIDWGYEDPAPARGLVLLREWLSPAQREMFDRSGHFEVIGSKTRRRYRISCANASMNVFELDRDGFQVDALCFCPTGRLVPGDIWLAQKIALETDEETALRVAHRASDMRDWRYAPLRDAPPT